MVFPILLFEFFNFPIVQTKKLQSSLILCFSYIPCPIFHQTLLILPSKCLKSDPFSPSPPLSLSPEQLSNSSPSFYSYSTKQQAWFFGNVNQSGVLSCSKHSYGFLVTQSKRQKLYNALCDWLLLLLWHLLSLSPLLTPCELPWWFCCSLFPEVLPDVLMVTSLSPLFFAQRSTYQWSLC